jgi:hypothetical protein
MTGPRQLPRPAQDRERPGGRDRAAAAHARRPGRSRSGAPPRGHAPRPARDLDRAPASRPPKSPPSSASAPSAADETFVNSDGSGLFVANRSGASATQCYRNGASLGSGTAATTIPGGAGNLFVCAMNPNEANPSTRQQALPFLGGSLTADEVAELYEAFAYYLAALGAI